MNNLSTNSAASINSALADIVGSASFLLTAIALLITAIAIGIGAWSNYQAKKMEWETNRLDLSYRLLLASAGGGDAPLPNQQTHYSIVEVQTVAIAALRGFPEYRDVYERLLIERNRQHQAENSALNQLLLNEVQSLVDSLQRDK